MLYEWVNHGLGWKNLEKISSMGNFCDRICQ
jgi:hypothetical protein